MKSKSFKIKHSANAGFSLIETLISFVVLAVGLLALLSFHSTSQKNISDAKSQAEAVSLAEEKLQELESFLDDSDDRLINAADCDAAAIQGTLASFTRCWVITSTDLITADGERKNARVNVTWTDRDNIAQEVVLNSEIYLRDPGLEAGRILRVVDMANQIALAENVWGGTGDGTGTGNGDGEGGGNGDDGTGTGTGEEGDAEEPYSIILLDIVGRISGSVQNVNLRSADIEQVSPETESLLRTNCSVQSLPGYLNSFRCLARYRSTLSGWSGSIYVQTNRNIVLNGQTCISGGQGSPSSVTINLNGITVSPYYIDITAC